MNLSNGNSPNSARHSGHVTLVTGWTLGYKCLDNVSCFSVACVRRPGLKVTINYVLSKHSLDCMCVHPALRHVTDIVWCPPLLDRTTLYPFQIQR